MKNTVKILYRHPFFISGVVLRLFLLFIVMPYAPSNWYVPFLKESIVHFSIDPWHTFLSSGGTSLAFPYGYVMWLILLPGTAVAYFFHLNLYWGYGITILGIDIGLLLLFKKLINISDKKLLTVYWLSPIVLFSSYWLGLNDIIPVFFLTMALLYVKRLRLLEAGILCGIAVSAKLSMVLVIPLFVIYLYRRKSLRLFLLKYLIGLSATIVVLGVPFILSSDALSMLMNNPEMGKVYDFSFDGNSHTTLYILPMVYLLTVFFAWSLRRLSFDLFFVFFGICFFLVLLLTPAAPGWFMWVMPLLIFYQATSERIAIFLVSCFTLLYVVTSILVTPAPVVADTQIAEYLKNNFTAILGEHGGGMLHTVLMALGIILIIRIWREAISSNNFFRFSRRPIVVGIAGDSGSGKDTLVQSLTKIFGNHSVVTHSGDDYHFWDRHKPMWDVMTHLNPRANNLEKFTQDLIALSDGKSIQARHYDHTSGHVGKPRTIKSNDIVITSGLHTLYLPTLRERYLLSIYLDIDEELRRYFKIQRDVEERGHSVEKVMGALEKRESDKKKFISPQSQYADLIFSLRPVRRQFPGGKTSTTPPLLKLSVLSKQGMITESLVRVLIGVCGLHVDMVLSGDNSIVELMIEGETSSDDIALAAVSLLPEMTDLIDVAPQWESGVKGLMQLITLVHIKQTLHRRYLQ